MKYIEIGAKREAHGVDDIVESTLTLEELIGILEELEDEVGEDAPIVLSHDGGYTYGSLHDSYISVEETESSEDSDDEEEEEFEVDDTFEESLHECDHRCEDVDEDGWDNDLDEDCLHCEEKCDDDFGDHENSYDVDEAYSFKGLDDRFGGKTLSESLRPRTIKRKKK